MRRKGCTWTAVLFGLIAVGLLLWLSPATTYRAAGLLLPSKRSRPTIDPSQVVALKKKPSTGHFMGYVNIERKYDANAQLSSEQEIWHLAQQLAARAGANALVIKALQVGAVTPGHYLYVFQAQAFFVSKLHRSVLPS